MTQRNLPTDRQCGDWPSDFSREWWIHSSSKPLSWLWWWWRWWRWWHQRWCRLSRPRHSCGFMPLSQFRHNRQARISSHFTSGVTLECQRYQQGINTIPPHWCQMKFQIQIHPAEFQRRCLITIPALTPRLNSISSRQDFCKLPWERWHQIILNFSSPFD